MSANTFLSLINNNNNDFFCTNILEDQAQWRDKTNGLSKLVIVKQCVSRQWMDEDARKPRRIGSIKEILKGLNLKHLIRDPIATQ